tara:strand:- start:123 stop:821 length:699 start_codon:yes stop_codon:yes gene_type:complete
MTFGFKRNSDLYVEEFESDIEKTNVSIIYKNKKYKFRTNLIGKFNVYNILAAISTCIALKIDLDKITSSIKNVNQIPGRMEKIKIKNNNIAIVDYAHTPDAYSNVLSSIHRISLNKKIITIFGCGGNRDKTKRALMGKIAEEFSDEIIITTDNPRFEKQKDIVNDIVSNLSNDAYKIIPDRKKAIKKTIDENKDSVIIVLGKGAESYQIIENKKIPHSDIEIIKEYADNNKR